MLFVFDIDGTIVSHSKNPSYIPKSTIKAIELIFNSGYKVIVATGRTYTQSKNVMELLGVTDGIFSDGSTIVINNNVVSNEVISKEAYESFINDCKKNNLTALAQDHMYNYLMYSPTDEEAVDIIESYAKGMDNPDYIKNEIPNTLECNLFSCFSQHDFQKFDDISYTAWTKGTSMKPKNVNKASGIKKYIELANISYKQVHVFGDNFNDIEMFQEFYEHSNVLGDAPNEVKEYAKNILNSIDCNGIYNRIINILKIQP